MTTKGDIILAIQAAADTYAADPAYPEDARNAIAISLGTPGSTVVVAGQRLQTGSAWEPEPRTFPTVIEGLADWFTAQGSIPAIVGKVNELVSAYNQLRADYNGGVVPTMALEIDPL
jgi:hypothetical protein